MMAAAGPSFLVGRSKLIMSIARFGTRIVTYMIGIIIVAPTRRAVIGRSRIAITTTVANRTTRSTTAVYMSPVESSGSWIFDRTV